MVKRQIASTGEIVEDNQPAPGKPEAKGLVLEVKVYSPFKVYYAGEAASVSAVNATGPFDILPKHHNFITLLNPCDLTIRTTEGDKIFRITRGIMHVKKNNITVFLDI
jgi:F0F1-type ATP synthase epsilon subunit